MCGCVGVCVTDNDDADADGDASDADDCDDNDDDDGSEARFSTFLARFFSKFARVLRDT